MRICHKNNLNHPGLILSKMGLLEWVSVYIDNLMFKSLNADAILGISILVLVGISWLKK